MVYYLHLAKNRNLHLHIYCLSLSIIAVTQIHIFIPGVCVHVMAAFTVYNTAVDNIRQSNLTS